MLRFRKTRARYKTIKWVEPPKEQRPERDEKAIKAIKGSLDQRWSKIVKCKTVEEWGNILDSTTCALCLVYGDSGELCPLSGEICEDKYCVDEWANFGKDYYRQSDGGKSMYDLLCRKYFEYSGEYYEQGKLASAKEHTEPKFEVGQMTTKGKVVEIAFSKNYNTWFYNTGELRWWKESELIAVPTTTVTLFKVKNSKVIDETITDIHGWFNKGIIVNLRDEVARMAFDRGYCAIIVDEGKTQQRRYCPEIEALPKEYGYFTPAIGWSGLSLSMETIEKYIYSAIHHPKWTVESPSGQKLRAYRMKDNVTKIEIDGEIGWHIEHPNDPILAALGVNPIPYCLHGHE
jgi:hypothetical protein